MCNLRVQLNIKYSVVKPKNDQLYLIRKWQANKANPLGMNTGSFLCCHAARSPHFCRGLLLPTIARYDCTRSKHKKKKRTVKATGVMPALGYCDGLSFARTCTVPVWPPPPEISLVNNPRKKLAIEPRGSLSCSSSMWPPAAPLPVPVETNCLCPEI